MNIWLEEYATQTSPSKGTLYYSPTNTYYLLDNDVVEDFWTKYSELVDNNPNLYEVISRRNYTKIAMDIKMKFTRDSISLSDMDDLENSIIDYIKSIIYRVQDTLGSYFSITEEECEMIACFLGREEPFIQTSEMLEYDARIIFPYANIETKHIEKFYNMVLNELVKKNPVNSLPYTPLNGLDSIINPIVGELFEMYGSTRFIEQPFVLDTIFGPIEDGDTYQLDENIFLPQHHLDVKREVISGDDIEPLVLFLSANFYDGVADIIPNTIFSELERPILKKNKGQGGENLDKLDYASKLLSLINDSRADQEWSWRDIGEAIHSINSEEDGLKIWKWFSRKGDSKTEEDCENEWSSFSNHTVNIKTLEWLAQKDNEKKYNEVRETIIEGRIFEAIEFYGDVQIAAAFKECYPHKFVCASYNDKIWYKYSGHYWVQVDGNSTIIKYIDKFKDRIEKMRYSYIVANVNLSNSRASDRQVKKKNEEVINSLSVLIKKISSNGKIGSVCDQLRVKYKDKLFNARNNKNPFFTATPNGVIDVRGGVAIFREGKPQDYITKCTNIPYDRMMKKTNISYKELKRYFIQLFPSKAKRRYMKKMLAASLRSGNVHKLFPILTGKTNNSKSALVRLLEFMYGNYVTKGPSNFFTAKKGPADGPSPVMAHIEGSKLFINQEPEKGAVLITGRVNEHTGGDTLFFRDLFQKGSSIREMFVTYITILVCNDIPEFDNVQDAIFTRARVVEFTSTWYRKEDWEKDYNLNEDQQFAQGKFLMDENFDAKIPIMAPALLWMMVRYYEKYTREGLETPDEVKIASKELELRNNHFIRYAKSNVERVLLREGDNVIPDRDACVPVNEMYIDFKMWYADEGFKGKLPLRDDFKKYMEISNGFLNENGIYYGVRLKFN